MADRPAIRFRNNEPAGIQVGGVKRGHVSGMMRAAQGARASSAREPVSGPAFFGGTGNTTLSEDGYPGRCMAFHARPLFGESGYTVVGH